MDVKRQKAPYIDIQMSRPRKTFWALLELKMRLHCRRIENLTVSWVKLYEMTVARRDWRNWCRTAKSTLSPRPYLTSVYLSAMKHGTIPGGMDKDYDLRCRVDVRKATDPSCWKLVMESQMDEGKGSSHRATEGCYIYIYI